MSSRLILASQSPRRRQLLALLGVDFDVVSANVDESPVPGEQPAALAGRLAAQKAMEIMGHSDNGYRVLGGDTVVALEDLVLGKPGNRDEAITMLTMLSGKTHHVFSAVSLADENGCRTLVSDSRVTFADLDEATIEGYCDSDDPYDKAGAYGIQGLAGKFVIQLEGSYTGVMGLSLWHTHQLLMDVRKAKDA